MLKKYEVLKENRVAKLVIVAALTVLIAVGFIVGGVIAGRNAIIVEAGELTAVTSADGKKMIPGPYSPVNVTGVTIIDENGNTQNNVDLAAFDFHVFAEYFASNAHTCGNIAVNSLGKTDTLGATGAPEFGSRPNHDVDVPKLSYIGETNGWSAAAISDYFVFGPTNKITEKAGQVFIENNNGKWMMGNGKKLMEGSYIEKNAGEFLNITEELQKAEGYQRYLVKMMDEAKATPTSQPDVKVLKASEVVAWSPWGNTIDVSKYAEDTIVLDISGTISTFSWFGPMEQDAVTSFISGQINIVGTEGKRVIINVDMTDRDNVNFFDTNMKSDNLSNSEDSALTDNNILWNFYERSGDSVNSYDGTFSIGGTWVGTVLAPEASLKCRAGLNGSMIVRELTTTAETHKSDYTGERSIDDLTDITITKHWQDDPALRPEYITIELKQNNKVYKTVQMIGSADEDTWTYTFTDLPVRDAAGQTYQYEITEKPVPGYKASQMGYVLYNVSDAKPKNYKLTVNKVGENNQPLDGATLVLTSDTRANLSKVKPTEATKNNVSNFTATDASVTWTSGSGAVVLEHLPAGKYTITEKGAPAGYVIAAEEKITLNADMPVTIVNKKAETLFKKVDKNGNLLSGAVLNLTSNNGTGLADVAGTITFESQSDGSVVWKSGAVAQTIKGLPAGTYTLSETSAPKGYDAAAPIIFTVDDSGKVFINGVEQSGATVTMTDNKTPEKPAVYKVQITKKEGNTALAGVTLKMYHSNGALLDGVTLPGGASLSADKKYITWETVDGDNAGMVFANMPSGTYIVEEVAVPDGYVKANPISFNLSATPKTDGSIDHDEVIQNTRNSATISKLDAFSANASTQLEGAVLSLKHNGDKSLAKVDRGSASISDDGKIISWTTTDTALQLKGLPEGEYTLFETSAPAGYATAADVIFNVDEYGNITSNGRPLTDKVVTMLDEPNTLGIAKNYYYAGNADGSGSSTGTLPGAKLQLTGDKSLSKVEGSIEVAHPSDKVITWTSGSAENILRYLPDGSYTLSELEAPAGYDKAADITFKVSGGKITESSAANSISADSKTLTMTDNKTVYYSVNIAKTDLESNPLAGAQLAIYKVNPDTNAVDYDNPVVIFESTEELNSLRLDNGDYVLKEISAPEGYYKSEEEIKFNVNNGDVTVESTETIKADPITQTLTFDENGNASIDITGKVKEFGLPTKVEYSYENAPNKGETTQYGDWAVEREAPNPLTKDYQAGSEDIYGTMATVTGGSGIGTPESITIAGITGDFNNAIITIKDDSDQYGNTYAKYRFSYQNIKDGQITVAKTEGSLNAFESTKTYTIYYEIHSPNGDVNFYVVFGDPTNAASVASLDDGVAVASADDGIMLAAASDWTITPVTNSHSTSQQDVKSATLYGTADTAIPTSIKLTLDKDAPNGGEIIIKKTDGTGVATYSFNANGTVITGTTNSTATLTANTTYDVYVKFWYIPDNTTVTVTAAEATFPEEESGSGESGGETGGWTLNVTNTDFNMDISNDSVAYGTLTGGKTTTLPESIAVNVASNNGTSLADIGIMITNSSGNKAIYIAGATESGATATASKNAENTDLTQLVEGQTYNVYLSSQSSNGTGGTATVNSLVIDGVTTFTGGSSSTDDAANGWYVEAVKEGVTDNGQTGYRYGYLKNDSEDTNVTMSVPETITFTVTTADSSSVTPNVVQIRDTSDGNNYTNYTASSTSTENGVTTITFTKSGGSGTINNEKIFTADKDYEIALVLNNYTLDSYNSNISDVGLTMSNVPTTGSSDEPETPAGDFALDAGIVINNNGTDVIADNSADVTFDADGTKSANITYTQGYEAGKTPDGVTSTVFNVKQTDMPEGKLVTVTLTFADRVATKVETSGEGDAKVNNLSLANKPIPAENRPECAVQLTKHDSTNAVDEDGNIDESKCTNLTSSAAGFELYNAKNNKPVHVTKTGEGAYEWNGNADYALTAQQQTSINITDYVNKNGLPHTVGFTFGSVNEDDGLKVSAVITNESNGKTVTLPAMNVASTNVYWKNIDLSALDYQNGNSLKIDITQSKDKGDYKAADINLYQTLYTNNAQLNVTKLDEGEYLLVETKLPTDYDYTTDANGMAVKSQRFTLTKDTTTQVTQNNIKKTGSVTIVKYDDNGNAKGGTVFELYQVDSNGNATVYSEYTTGDGGSVVADDLPLGYLYYAKEKTPPAGAILDSTDPMPVNFTDEKGGYLINYANREYTYGVLLSENITSTYKQNSSNGNADAKVEVLSIGNSGNAVYSTTAGVTTFQNTAITAAFEKTDASGAPLAGAKLKLAPVFASDISAEDKQAALKAMSEVISEAEIDTTVVYNYNASGDAVSIENVYIEWTSGNAPVVLEGLPAGNYTLTETEAPLGYALAADTSVSVTVEANNKIYVNGTENGKAAMSDAKLTGTLTLTKYEDNYASLVPGAGFELYAKGEGGEYNIPIKADGSAGAAGEDAAEFFSDANGVITVAGLPIDLYKDYRFVETTVPAGFVEPAAATTVDISFTDDEIQTASANGESAVEKGDIAFNEKEAIVVVTKKWVDESNRDGKRPASITVDIYNGNTVVKADVEITANGTGDEWTYEVPGLPARDTDGNIIEYTVKEKNVPAGYTASEEGLTVTNTHTLETVDISVTKTWADGSATKVESVTVELWADGAATGETATLSAPSWTASFAGLDKNKAGAVGEAISYTVKETAVAGYVTSAATGSIADGFTVTNTPIIVNIAKTNENDAPLAGAKLQLTPAASTDLSKVYSSNNTTFKAENGVITWTSADTATAICALPAGTYTLSEVEAPQNYAKAASITFTVKADGTIEGSTNTTVTMSDELMKGIATLTKKDAASGAILAGAEFSLLENGTAVKVSAGANAGEYTYDPNGTITTLVTNAQGKIIVNNLPVDKSFSFSETKAPAGYIKSAAAIEFSFNADDVKTASANGAKTVSVEREAANTKVTGSVTLTKKELGTANVIAGAKFKLYNAADAAKTALTFNGADGVYTYAADGTVTELETNASGQITVNGLPVDAAADTVYKFAEISAPEGYIKSDAEYTVTFTDDDVNGAAAAVITAPGFDVTNTKKTSVSFKKVWEDDLTAHSDVTVRLYERTTDGGNTTDTYVVGKTAVLNADNSWKAEFTDLPERDAAGNVINYVVKEDSVIGYNSKVTAGTDVDFVITNTPTTDMVITKRWEDGSNADSTRPDSVQVEIVQHVDGREDAVYQTVTINKVDGSNEWTSATISELPTKTDDGKAITYSVREKAGTVPAGYESSVSGAVITNTLKTSVTIEKQWDDNGSTNKRPAEITVQLYADGTAYGDPVKVEASKDWKYTWNDLDKFSGDDEIEYTAAETAVPENYVSTQTEANAENGFVIKNVLETSVTVTKVWNDNNNIAGKRPASVTVQLYKGEGAAKTAVGAPVTLNSSKVDGSGNWIYTWNDLPMYDNGAEIAYSVEEDLGANEGGYTSAVEGFVITNSLAAEKVNVTISKTWDDNNNAKGIRPTEITVQLYADNAPVGDPVTITAAADGTWSYTWPTQLDKYAAGKNGVAIVYSVRETDVVGYTAEYNGTVIKNKLNAPDVTISKVDAVGGNEIAGAELTLKMISATNEGDTLANAKGSIEVEYIAETNEIKWTSEEGKVNELWGIPLGHYRLTEVLVPDGYEQAEAIDFIITEESGVRKIYVYNAETEDYDIEVGANTVIMRDEPQKAVFSKVDAGAGGEIAGADLKITPVKPEEVNFDGVTAPDHVTVDKENKVITWESLSTPTEIGQLPAGEYVLREETAPDGFLVAEEMKFKVNENHTVEVFNPATNAYEPVTDNTVIMKDEPIKAVFSKVDAGAGNEIAGATLVIAPSTEVSFDKVTAPDHVTVDKENKTITWVSTTTPTEIGMLPEGEYTLTETGVPDGFLKAETIAFKVNANHTVEVYDEESQSYIPVTANTVVMKDAPQKAVFSKVDAGAGNEIAGAKLIITAGEGVTLDAEKIELPTHAKLEDNTIEWTSTTTPTQIGMLPAGEYTLTEITAPDGYEVAESIKFKVNPNHTVEVLNPETKEYEKVTANTVVMKDEPIKAVFSKVDAGAGTELEGAKLIIEVVSENVKVDGVDAPKHVTVDKDKNTISWTSTDKPTEIGQLPEGEYTLTEITAPDGYEVAETIRFKVNPNHTISVYNTETKEFEPVDDNTVVMKDAPQKAKFSKKIAGGSTELAGAKLEIKPSTKGVKIDDVEVPAGVTKDTKNNAIKWTSTTTPIEIGGLPAGEYILVETQAPNGYEIAETIKFRVNDNHTVSVYDTANKKYVPVDDNTVVMYDKASPAPVKATLSFIKRSDKGMTLSGAEFKLSGEGYTKSVTTVEGGTVTFVDIPAGTFTLTEVTAPIGYTKSTSVITVVVDKDGAITFKDAAGKTLTKGDVEKAMINTEKGSGGTTTTTTTTTTTRTTTTTTRNINSNVQGDGNNNNPNTGDASEKNIQAAMVGLQLSIAAMLACAVLYIRRRKRENA